MEQLKVRLNGDAELAEFLYAKCRENPFLKNETNQKVTPKTDFFCVFSVCDKVQAYGVAGNGSDAEKRSKLVSIDKFLKNIKTSVKAREIVNLPDHKPIIINRILQTIYIEDSQFSFSQIKEIAGRLDENIV
jgi:hypothetical protein